MARLLLGVSGGIAAYKALETSRLAIKAGHVVRVIMTPTAERFVGRASFEGITGAPVLISEFEPDPARGAYPGDPPPERAPISHLALVETADVYLVAPASANTLAKLAHGHADNLLCAAALAAPCPLLVAPAMNNRMWTSPATQGNVELLRRHGVTVIAPTEGELGSHGEYGIGRLAEPAALLAACEAQLGQPSLAGVRVLVTAGGTREPIDSVRFIGNRSSGRMGMALAAEAARRGAAVTVIAADVTVDPPAGARVIHAPSAAQLADACRREFEATDVLLMAAAVADFRPANPSSSKLKKDAGPPSITLEPTEDVLGSLAASRRPGQVVVGFAAEHGAGALDYAADKLDRKRLDAIVVNDISDPSIGFEAGENEVTILTAGGRPRHVARTAKSEVAAVVLDLVQDLRTREGSGGALRAHPRSAARI